MTVGFREGEAFDATAPLRIVVDDADPQVFPPPPSAKGPRETPDLFRDPPGGNRHVIHAQAAAEALRGS